MGAIPIVRKTTTSAASGNGNTATLTLAESIGVKVGDTIVVSGITPAGYNGSYTVTSVATNPARVSYACKATGAQTVSGTVTTSSYTNTATTTGAGGDGTYVTLQLSSPLNVAIGDRITVTGMSPSSYNGTWEVTSSSDFVPYSVSFRSPLTAAQTAPGTVKTSKTVFSAGDWGLVGQTFGGLDTRTQSTVEATLKGQVQSSNSWSNASNILFGNGILDSSLPFPVAILKGIGESITRAIFGPSISTVEDVLSAIEAWFEGLIDPQGKWVGDVKFGVMDGQKTVGTFLDEVWRAITGQNGSNKTVTNVSDALGDLAETANVAFENATAAGDLVEDVVSSGSNLIKNGGFENILFQQLGSLFSFAQKRSGSKSLQITGNGFATVSYVLLSDEATQRFLKVTPGDILYAEVYVLGAPGNTQTSGGAGAIRMLFEPFDGANNALLTSIFSVAASTALNGVWTKLSGYVTVPPDAARLKISLQLLPAVKAFDSYFFDDVVVREVTLASTANASANTAQTTANTASLNAATAQSAAETADGKAVAADNKAQNAGDLALEVITSGANLIKNPGFENIFFQQFGSVFTMASQYVRSGSKSLQLVGNQFSTVSYVLLSDDTTQRFLQINAGDILYAEVWVRGATSNTQTSGGADAVRMRFEPINGSNAVINTQDISTTASTALNNGWVKLSGYVTMPVDTTRVRISLQLTSAVKLFDSYFFDDVVVREVTLASAANAAAGTAQTTANTASLSAASAATAAANADSKAVAADGKAVAADGKAVAAQGSANTANAGVQTTADNIYRGVFGGSSTGNPLSSIVTSLQKGWAEFWDGLTGGSNTAAKLPGDVRVAAAGVRSTANTADTTASTAQSNVSLLGTNLSTQPQTVIGSIANVVMDGVASVGNFLNSIWEGLTGQTGTGKSVANVKVAAAGVNTTANNASTTASTAVTNAAAAKTVAEAAIASGQSILPNGGFEDTSFGLNGLSYTTEDKYSGTRSALFTSNGSWVAGTPTLVRFPCNGGDVFWFDGWIKGKSTNTVSGTIYGTSSAYNKDGTKIGDYAAWSVNTLAVKGVWTQVGGFMTMPAGATSFSPYFSCSPITAGQVFYIDEIRLYRATEAVAADAKAQGTVDAIVQAVDGGAATGAAPATTKSKLQKAWADFWDGLTGGSGTASKLPADVRVAAAGVRSTANNADTTASTASSSVNLLGTNLSTQPQTVIGSIANVIVDGVANVSNFLSGLWEGLTGQSGSGKTVANVKVAAASVNTTANNASVTASAASGAAATADSKAVVAQSVLSAKIAAGSNVVANPSFENTRYNHVASAGCGVVTDASRVGSRSIKLISSGSGYQAVNLTVDHAGRVEVPCSPGDVFLIEYWVRGSTSNSLSHAGSAFVQLNVRKTDGTFGYLSLAAAKSNSTTWVKVSNYVTMPALAYSFYADAYIGPNTQSGTTYWIDDVVIREVTEGNVAKANAQVAQATAETGVANAATASSNLQSVVDNIFRSVFGGSSSNNPVTSVITSLQRGWAEFWDGLTGGSGSTSKLPSDVRVAAAGVRTTANNANTTAGTASSSVNLLGTNLSTQPQTVIGSIANVVMDGVASVGNFLNSIWEGLTGQTGTGKSVANVKTAAASVNTTANNASVTASAASGAASTAQTSANTANTTVRGLARAGSNLVIGPDFEDTSIPRLLYGNSGGVYSTEQKRSGSRSFKWFASSAAGVGMHFDNGDPSVIVATAPGEVFYLEAWLYAPTANNHAVTNAWIQLNCSWSDSSGVNANTFSAASIRLDSFIKGQWTKISLYATCPAGRDRLQIFLISTANTPDGNVYYADDFLLREVTLPVATNKALYNSDTAASQILTGAVPNLDGSKITGGTVAADRIASLPGEKITSGTVAEARVQNLTTAKNNAANALTNAATADGKAVLAQGAIDLRARDFTNIAAGSDFEGANPWTVPASWSVATDQFNSGSKSFKATGAYATSTLSNVLVQTTAGEQFYVEFWLRRDAAWTTAPGATRLRVYNAVGGATVLGLNFGPATLPSANTWLKYAATATIGNDFSGNPVSSIGFQLQVDTSAGGTVWIDDIIIRRVATGEVIANSAITTTKLADLAVTGAKTTGLDGSKITGGTVAEARIATLSQGKVSGLTTDLGNRVDYSAYQAYLSGGGKNLCTNPSFEDTTQYLSQGTYNSNAAYVRSGTRSAALVGNGTQNQWLSLCNSKTAEIWLQTIPSQTFYLECYVMGDPANTASAALLRFGIWVYPGTSTAAISSHPMPALTHSQIGTGTWVKWSGYVTIGSASNIARMRPLMYAEASNNTYYIDDVVIVNVTESVDTNKALYNANTPAATILTGAVPNLDGSKITGGTVAADRIANLDAAKIASGSLADARIPNLATTKITTGTFLDARIPGLDGSKITGGTINEARVQNLQTTRANTEATINNIAAALTGLEGVNGAAAADALAALQKTYNTLDELYRSVQDLQSEKESAQVKGTSYNLAFSSFSNGAFPNSGAGSNSFNTIYSTASGSLIGVQNGVAQWYSTTNVSRDAKLIWQKPTNTDFQVIRGTMTSPPQQPGGGAQAPKFHAIGRVNAAGTTFVWARAYCDGFLSYKGEIGCTVNNTEYVWATNIPLTWSLDMKFVLGIGTNARQYQVYSGTTLVWTHTESGSASTNYTTKNSTSAVQSTLGASNRLWGALAQIRSGTGGPYHSGKVSGTSVSDNQTPAVNGSVARMTRNSTTAVSYAGGSALTALPNSFFDTITYESPDVDADTTTCSFTVAESKPYIVTARVLTGNVAAWGNLVLQKWNGSSWVTSQYGNPIYTQDGVAALSGSWIEYLNAGEKVRLAYQRAGITVTSLTGESTGSRTYFSIAGAG